MRVLVADPDAENRQLSLKGTWDSVLRHLGKVFGRVIGGT